jgi:aspartate kinase
MGIIVQKFGGTSVADSRKILAAARKAIRAQQQGYQVVMVVSARGHHTDELIELARQISDRPPAREMDMLLATGEQVSVALMAMAIHSLGSQAVSLTGAQIGIQTDSSHTKARIRSISTDRIKRLLDEGNIVIAAGFQGIDEKLNITTLGRGGSDTTAVALAAVLRADACEIYTDVDGVYTTDPRVVPEARRVDRISYDEMLELASLGAGVMHNRSIEFAKKYGVAIHVRSSLSDAPGTMIVAEPESLDHVVCGAALNRNEARVTLAGIPDVPGTSDVIFTRLAERHISVDMIVQNVGAAGLANLSFTVPRDELAVTLEAVEAVRSTLGDVDISADEEVAKVSVVGLGMARHVGVADRVFQAVAETGANIQLIATSEIKISVLVERSEGQRVLRVVHQAFQLDQPPGASSLVAVSAPPQRAPDVADVVARLEQGLDMERTLVRDITLDQKQARITISGIPDIPGVASEVFQDVAAAGIFVDMIIQSHKGRGGEALHSGSASLSFTVPHDQWAQAAHVSGQLIEKYPFVQVNSSPEVAKLSISGIGLRSHTGVAGRAFAALSAGGINIEMVSTSEVRINIVVAAEKGAEALEALKTAFADSMG